MVSAGGVTRLLIAGGMLLACPHAGNAQSRAASVYTVSNIRAEASAENSVEAKKQATLQAETQALRTLIGRLADFRAQSRIPDVPQGEVERLVAEIQVRNEGVSGTAYVATFGVTFSERAVDALLARYGVLPIVERGPEITIVPVYIEGGAARPSDRNPWRNALAQLDLAHALVPARIAPVRSDITAAIANAYIGNPSAGLDALKSQYHTTQLMLAVAELDIGGELLNVRLIGSDALGLFTLQRKLQSKDGVDEALMKIAANVALNTVQERWKLTRAGAGVGADASAGAASMGFSSGGLVSVQVTAEFSGLREWQTIRTRLQKMPGLQNWDLKSVNPRSAQIAFDFPGGAERLASIAEAQGLSVENRADGLVIKTR